MALFVVILLAIDILMLTIPLQWSAIVQQLIAMGQMYFDSCVCEEQKTCESAKSCGCADKSRNCNVFLKRRLVVCGCLVRTLNRVLCYLLPFLTDDDRKRVRATYDLIHDTCVLQLECNGPFSCSMSPTAVNDISGPVTPLLQSTGIPSLDQLIAAVGKSSAMSVAAAAAAPDTSAASSSAVVSALQATPVTVVPVEEVAMIVDDFLCQPILNFTALFNAMLTLILPQVASSVADGNVD